MNQPSFSVYFLSVCSIFPNFAALYTSNMNETLSLFELNHLVRATLEQTLDGEYWLHAELSEARLASNWSLWRRMPPGVCWSPVHAARCGREPIIYWLRYLSAPRASGCGLD